MDGGQWQQQQPLTAQSKLAKADKAPKTYRQWVRMPLIADKESNNDDDEVLTQQRLWLNRAGHTSPALSLYLSLSRAVSCVCITVCTNAGHSFIQSSLFMFSRLWCSVRAGRQAQCVIRRDGCCCWRCASSMAARDFNFFLLEQSVSLTISPASRRWMFAKTAAAAAADKRLTILPGSSDTQWHWQAEQKRKEWKTDTPDVAALCSFTIHTHTHFLKCSRAKHWITQIHSK